MKRLLAECAFAGFIIILAIPVCAGEFTKTTITVGSQKLTVELADKEDLRERGLQNRSSLSDKEGMLFVFPVEMELRFWMKNTLIPLSIGFFNSEGKLFQIMDMEPASPVEGDPKIYLSAKPSKYALEVARGWFKRKNVKVGDILKLPEPNKNSRKEDRK